MNMHVGGAVKVGALKLEHGKTYIGKSGARHKIVGEDNFAWPFKTADTKQSECRFWKANGEGYNTEGWNVHATTGDDLVAEVLTIEAGKFYKTRDGRKVGPLHNMGGYWSAYGCAGGNPGHYTNDGISAFCGTLPRAPWREQYDLIAEWIDEPAPAVTAKAEPKFKVGDRVEIVAGATIYKRRYIGSSFVIDCNEGNLDGEQAWSGKDHNSPYRFKESELRLVAPATIGKQAIVCLIENGQPLPSARPFVHSNSAYAEKEAERLAGKHKGKEFGVYTLGAVRKEEPVYEHEWQRLAVGGRVLDAIKELRRMSGLGLATSKAAVDDWLSRQ